MLTSSVFALVREPIIRCIIDTFPLISCDQLFHIRNPHRSTNNLSNIRHQQITALCIYRTAFPIARHLLHIKRLELNREPIQENRSPDYICHLPLSSFGDVVPDGVLDHLDLPLLVLDDVTIGVLGFVFDTVFVEPFNGVYVGETKERTGGGLEVRVKLLDEGAGILIFQEAVDGFTDLSRGCFQIVLDAK